MLVSLTMVEYRVYIDNTKIFSPCPLPEILPEMPRENMVPVPFPSSIPLHPPVSSTVASTVSSPVYAPVSYPGTTGHVCKSSYSIPARYIRSSS